MPKVNLKDYKPYFDVEVSKAYTAKERQAIAQDIIDEIINRTEEGRDADNRPFAQYTKDYVKFKGQSNVDLTYSMEMLNEIQLLQSSEGKIRIGFSEDYEGLGKVEGNIRGTYGQDVPIKGKSRNFLGITEKALKNILSDHPAGDLKNKLTREEIERAARRVAQRSSVSSEDVFDD